MNQKLRLAAIAAAAAMILTLSGPAEARAWHGGGWNGGWHGGGWNGWNGGWHHHGGGWAGPLALGLLGLGVLGGALAAPYYYPYAYAPPPPYPYYPPPQPYPYYPPPAGYYWRY